MKLVVLCAEDHLQMNLKKDYSLTILNPGHIIILMLKAAVKVREKTNVNPLTNHLRLKTTCTLSKIHTNTMLISSNFMLNRTTNVICNPFKSLLNTNLHKILLATVTQ
jgi:hypothetical protein